MLGHCNAALARGGQILLAVVRRELKLALLDVQLMMHHHWSRDPAIATRLHHGLWMVVRSEPMILALTRLLRRR